MKKENIFYSINRYSKRDFETNYREIFEDKMYSKLFEVNDNDIIMDLGANVGLYTLYATEGKNIKKAYMVEPMLENYKYMINNIIYNRTDEIDKFVFIKAAIDKKTGYSNIGAPIDCDHSSGSCGVLNTGEETTKTFKFMDFIKFYNIDKIDVIKMDIEGSELDIFEDDESIDFICSNVDRICGEFHPSHNGNGERFFKAIEKIKKFNYDVKLCSVDGFDITNTIMGNLKIGGKPALDYYHQYMFYAKKKHM